MSNPSTIEYLSTHEFLSEFNDDDLKFLCERSSTYEIKMGHILFRQGEKANRFYVVRNGRISLQMPAIMGPSWRSRRWIRIRFWGGLGWYRPINGIFKPRPKRTRNCSSLTVQPYWYDASMNRNRLRVVKEICSIDVGGPQCSTPENDGRMESSRVCLVVESM